MLRLEVYTRPTRLHQGAWPRPTRSQSAQLSRSAFNPSKRLSRPDMHSSRKVGGSHETDRVASTAFHQITLRFGPSARHLSAHQLKRRKSDNGRRFCQTRHDTSFAAKALPQREVARTLELALLLALRPLQLRRQPATWEGGWKCSLTKKGLWSRDPTAGAPVPRQSTSALTARSRRVSNGAAESG